MVRSLGALIVFAGACLFGSANAADINRTQNLALNPSGTTGFSDSFDAAAKGKTFSDLFSFNIGASSGLSASVISVALGNAYDLDITKFNLVSGANVFAGTKLSGGLLDTWTIYLNPSNIPAGLYSLEVAGKVLGTNGGSFGGNLNVSAVPEPETYLMMLIGLIGLVALSRRKNVSNFAGPALAA